MPATLNNIKSAMRISHNELDDVITSDMGTCIADLIRVGIQPYKINTDGDYILVDGEKVLKEDNLISKAVELYCKAQFDYLGKGEQFTKSYESLRDALSLCGDYIA